MTFYMWWWKGFANLLPDFKTHRRRVAIAVYSRMCTAIMKSPIKRKNVQRDNWMFSDIWHNIGVIFLGEHESDIFAKVPNLCWGRSMSVSGQSYIALPSPYSRHSSEHQQLRRRALSSQKAQFANKTSCLSYLNLATADTEKSRHSAQWFFYR